MRALFFAALVDVFGFCELLAALLWGIGLLLHFLRFFSEISVF